MKTFLRKKVAPQVAKMKENVIVGMDRGFHFKPHEAEDELKKGGAKNIEDVWIFPTNAGKLCNPLDNNLWHSMKQNVRKSHPDGEEATAKVVKKVFMKTPSKDLHQLNLASNVLNSIPSELNLFSLRSPLFFKKGVYFLFFASFSDFLQS